MTQFRLITIIVLAILLYATRADADPTPVAMHERNGEITIDGNLDDAAWEHAARVDQFLEFWTGDNTTPPVKTIAWITWDDAAIYVAFRNEENDMKRLRAPLVDRDQVLVDQDYVTVMLDAQNSRRAATLFRVNPRGVQTDGVSNDANWSEDRSPDFNFETATRIHDDHWTAEMRIPLSSLRFNSTSSPTLGLLLIRNYPRAFRYVMSNTPIPKNSNCFVCHESSLTGIDHVPGGPHWSATPYAAAANRQAVSGGATARGTDARSDFDSNFGFDLKYSPGSAVTFDATWNPDFSQVESDAPQLNVNNRFAVAYPEKRSFFLERVDLLTTPINAVSTRTIHAPQWGIRASGESGSNAYTFLASDDKGGGTLVIPGKDGSELVDQDFGSLALVGRFRRSLGRSFAGIVATAREFDGGDYSRLIGPDFQWNVTDADRVTAQVLFSQTENPDRPELHQSLDGRSMSSHAARLTISRDKAKYDWWLSANDFGDDFRADTGFVPMVGYRSAYAEYGYHVNRSGAINFIRPYVIADYAEDREGNPLHRYLYSGVYMVGKWNSDGWVSLHLNDQERVGDQLEEVDQVVFSLRTKPHRLIPSLQLNGTVGDRIDWANSRVGSGAFLSFASTIRPTDHLELQLSSDREWVDVESKRLFTAAVERVKATYSFTSRSLVRAVVQQTDVARDPLLYDSPSDVTRHERSIDTSFLYGYKLTYQTVFYIGYGDLRTLDPNDRLQLDGRSFFMKVAYAVGR